MCSHWRGSGRIRLIFRVIYLSLDKVHEALDAYKKAHALEPNNENYKQSIKLCEDRLNAAASSAMPGAMPGGVSEIYSKMTIK